MEASKDVEALLLRLLFPPLTVLLAGWAQHRLGPRRSGQLIGLPLTSGPFLLVLAWGDGVPAATVAARGVLAGQLLVLAFVTLYALGTTATSRPLHVMACVVPALLVVGAATHAWTDRAPWAIALVVVPLALLALARWRPAPFAGRGERPRDHSLSTTDGPSARELTGRATLTGVLVATLVASSSVLGPSLAGILAAVPLVVSVVVPGTHRHEGGAPARTLLRGTLAVVPGTATFAAVVAVAMGPLGVGTALALALASMLLVNQAVGRLDRLHHRPCR